MEEKIYFKWSNLFEEWIGAYYTWDDVAITIKVKDALGGNPFAGIPAVSHTYLPPQEIIKQTLTGKEYKKFVNLVCKVNGITTHQLKERNPECVMTLTEIDRVINEVLKPQVKVTQISRKDI